MKACCACGVEKTPEAYAVDRSKLDGRKRKCRECQKAYFSTYYARNKTDICSRTSAYQKKRPEVQRKAKLKWQANNKERHLESRRLWHEAKFAQDIEYRLNFTIRGALRRTLDAARRNKIMLGSGSVRYTPEMLKARIEMNFLPGMNWENYGEWHVDHRVPVARLIRKGVTSPAVINCLANLTPLWAEDNMRKGKR